MAKGSGTGQGGKSMQDRELAAKVRKLTLEKIAELFEMPVVKMTHADLELHNAILIRLAGTVLPRLNEHMGEGGDPIVISISKEIAEKRDLN